MNYVVVVFVIYPGSVEKRCPSRVDHAPNLQVSGGSKKGPHYLITWLFLHAIENTLNVMVSQCSSLCGAAKFVRGLVPCMLKVRCVLLDGHAVVWL